MTFAADHVDAAPGNSRSASQPAPAQTGGLPPETLAIVNGVKIPQSQLDQALRARGQPDTPQTREAGKQDLIVRELLRQSAEKAHYSARPEVQDAMSAAKANTETQLYLRDNIHPQTVTDAQVKARYDEIVAALGREEYKPRIIVIAEAETAATVLGQLKSGQSFDAVARQYSKAMSASSGGELPWVSFPTPAQEGRTQGLPLALAEAITRLSPGAYTPRAVALGNDGKGPYAIVKLDVKRPTQVPAFDQAQGTLRQQLQSLATQKAQADLTIGLAKAARIEQ